MSENNIMDRKVPTERQELTAKYVVDDGMTIEDAMRKAGYGDGSISVRSVMNTKIWPVLMDKYLKDSYLLDKHKGLLEKKETYRQFNKVTGRVEIVRTDEIDATAVQKGLDMAYKLKGRYSDGVQVNVATQINLDEARSEFEVKEENEN